MLFTPFKLGEVELANRVVVSPMCQYCGVAGVAQPWHTVHIGGMAKSGPGLVILEATNVEPAGMITPACLGLWNDVQEAALAKLVADVRSFSAVPLGIQLGHAGRKASTQVPWLGRRRGEPLTAAEGAWQTCGPSALPYAPGWQTPSALDERGLARIKAAFVQAARRADRAGFDVVELHAAHGYLLSSFYSPLSNHRTDRYGGTLENRIRFALEIAAAVRAALPAHKALGVRINGSDWAHGGSSEADAAIYVRNLKAVGADYAIMSAGNVVPETTLPPIRPGYMAHFADAIRAAGIDIALMAVGMIVAPDFAQALVASGRADCVAVGRAFLDDPHWTSHAAMALGIDHELPKPYRAVGPRWPGHALAPARMGGGFG